MTRTKTLVGVNNDNNVELYDEDFDKLVLTDCNNSNIYIKRDLIINVSIFNSNVKIGNVFINEITFLEYIEMSSIDDDTTSSNDYFIVDFINCTNTTLYFVVDDVILYRIDSNNKFVLIDSIINNTSLMVDMNISISGNILPKFENKYIVEIISISDNEVMNEIDMDFVCDTVRFKNVNFSKLNILRTSYKRTYIKIDGCNNLRLIKGQKNLCVRDLCIKNCKASDTQFLFINIYKLNRLDLHNSDNISINTYIDGSLLIKNSFNIKILKEFKSLIIFSYEFYMIFIKKIFYKTQFIHFCIDDKYIDHCYELLKNFPIFGNIDIDIHLGYLQQYNVLLKNITDNSFRYLKYKYPLISNDILKIISTYM